MKSKFTLQTVNSLLNINESFKVPDRLMEILFSKEERELVFKNFLKIDTDLSFDWFHQYFEEEQAERKTNKQDFTPESVATIMSRLVGLTPDYFETAAGTGGIAITNWWRNCIKESPLTYFPHEHFAYLEELSDRAVPFLLFNLAIRGMNAIVIHGDSLERTSKGVFLIENSMDDMLKFSDINIMPYSDEVKKYFQIKKWDQQRYVEHIETDSDLWLFNVSQHIEFKHGLHKGVESLELIDK